MLSSEPQWVAVYTNPRAEKKVEKNLKEAGFEAYLPLRRELHTWSDRKKWVEMPLLKSYVFVRITKIQLDSMRAVPGISFVISFKKEVATIPDREIQMIKDFLAAEVDVQVRTVERLKRGTHVRIHSGPLEGKEGMLVSDCEDGNFAVEITGISMAMIVHIDRDLMEEIVEDETAKQKSKKYTIR
ncbi:MAG: UpxY family transcription antiterminator [Bacteroidales bacterium]|nr:UpxY family transcription antiterminator [Bacteroidales bacterium]